MQNKYEDEEEAGKPDLLQAMISLYDEEIIKIKREGQAYLGEIAFYFGPHVFTESVDS